jgi:DNA-binding HxlR family transcriptional regulator
MKALTLRDLGKVGALDILVYLHDNKDRKINITELNQNVKASRETILSTLKMLRAHKLIEEENIKKFPCEHLVWLTKKGVEVAVHMKAAHDVLLGQEHPKKVEDSGRVK